MKENENMKKTYTQPTILVAQIQQQGIICSSELSKVKSNAELEYEGAGDGTAAHGGTPRSRHQGVWENEDEY